MEADEETRARALEEGSRGGGGSGQRSCNYARADGLPYKCETLVWTWAFLSDRTLPHSNDSSSFTATMDSLQTETAASDVTQADHHSLDY